MWLSDGNILVTGSSAYTSPFSANDTGYMTISKFSPGFNLIWNKSFPVYGPYSGIYGALESSDGSIFLNYVEDRNFCQKISLLKINSQGDLLWLKNYTAPNTCIIGYTGSVTQDNNALYLMNFEFGTPGPLLLKINKATGLPVWTKGYNIPGSDQCKITNNIGFLGNDLVMQGLVSYNTGPSKDVVMIIDTNGVIKKAKYFRDNGNGTGYIMQVTQDRQLVLSGGGYQSTPFVRLDSNLNIIYSKKTISASSGMRSLKEAADGSIYGIGYNYFPSPYTIDMSVKKYTPDGFLGGCYTDTLVLTTGDQAITVTNVTPNIATGAITLYSLPYTETTYSLQESELLCGRTACSTIHLSAPAGVCDTAAYTITGLRNAGCDARIDFSYDTAMVKEVGRTDTTIVVKFLQSGTVTIRAKIFTGCVFILDSVSVNVTISNSELNLGPDTALCSGNSILLNAHQGYLSYLWNTGSVDSAITVITPGTYYVAVMDACGKASSDTVIVTTGAAVVVDIGPDRSKYNNDTLHLSGPGGFLNYYWTPAYNISSQLMQQVTVQPATDTVYYLKAEKTPGCFGYDTVRIKVYHSSPLYLGTDKAICNGDSIVLDAGAGFPSYLWNTGQLSQQLSIKSQGDYSIKASNVEGCNSYDTVHVDVWPNPVPQLNKQNTLCTGTSRTLQPGSFNSYLWQDGSTLAFFTLNAIGKYYVTVTDIHSCKGSDTVNILKLLRSPNSFLLTDTTLCSYNSILLKPLNNFTDYLWNTGAVTSAITVFQPGIYWLQVKDGDQCIGIDSIIIKPADCLKGLFVPNAFTPDNNNQNDKFKPSAGGILKQYQFAIYNRYGQVIFRTQDINHGWDGKIAGVLQNPGTFVWVCTYQLEGAQPKNENGTFLLIR